MSNDIEHKAFWCGNAYGGIKINECHIADWKKPDVFMVKFETVPFIKFERKRPYRQDHLTDTFNYLFPIEIKPWKKK